MREASAVTAAIPMGRRRRVSVWTEVKALVALSVPVVAGLIGATIVSVIDSWMLGPLGAVPLAAASLTQSFLVIFYAGLYGFVGAIGLLAGQAHGAGDPRRNGNILWHGLVIGLLGGVVGALLMAAFLGVLPHTSQPSEVLEALPAYWLAMSALLVPFSLAMAIKLFLDSVGRAWTAAFLNLLPAVFAVPLNWALIYGKLGLPALGLYGCGLANFLAFAAAVLVMLLYLLCAPSMAVYRRGVSLRLVGFGEQLREGIPMAVQYLAEGGAVAVAGVLIGWLGATALAANQIVFSVGATIYMAPLGLSAAVGIRIAQALGEGEAFRIRAIGLSGLAVVTLWMLGFTAMMVLWGEPMARAFVDDPDVVKAATLLFITIGVMQVFDGVQSVSLGALRGLLDNRWPTCVSLVSYWLVALPLCVLFGFALPEGTTLFGIPLPTGASGVWAGFGIGLAVAAALLTWRFIWRTRRMVAV